MGLAVGANRLPDEANAFAQGFAKLCETMAATRPTAVNLFWAINKQKEVFEKTLPSGDLSAVKKALEEQALAIWRDDQQTCKRMGDHGAELIADGASILTHCNAGALATGGYGTALGVIRSAAKTKKVRVFADETRPYLQGARLTAWELHEDNIDVSVICDNQAGYLFRKREIDCCIVGADRIAANGDVANKIGTFSVAVLAHYHKIPFYVAAPLSTIDLDTLTGTDIPIEDRPRREVTHMADSQLVPDGVPVRNAAFDVTPAHLVDAIITEKGVVRTPNLQSIRQLFAD
jgi:methylthioribose-1-phosphate isomerase